MKCAVLNEFNYQIINTLSMKINIKITDKDRHFLYRLLAVVLFFTNTLTMWFCAPELDKYIKNPLAGIVAFWLIASLILTGFALFKHYR